jgi:hypothetical protein
VADLQSESENAPDVIASVIYEGLARVMGKGAAMPWIGLLATGRLGPGCSRNTGSGLYCRVFLGCKLSG